MGNQHYELYYRLIFLSIVLEGRFEKLKHLNHPENDALKGS